MTSHLGARIAQSVNRLGYTGWKISSLNPGGVRDFCLLQNIQSDSGPPSFLLSATGILSWNRVPRAWNWTVKPFSAKVESKWKHSSSPPHTFTEWRAATLHFTPMTSRLISHITDSCCIWNTQRKVAPPPKTGRQNNSSTACQIKLLEGDALLLGAEILIFQRITANCLQSPAPKMRALQSFQKSGTIHPTTYITFQKKWSISNTTVRTSKLAFLAILIQLTFCFFPSYLETFMHAYLLPLKTTNFGEILHVLQSYSMCYTHRETKTQNWSDQ
jgi:hypothetical protein